MINYEDDIIAPNDAQIKAISALANDLVEQSAAVEQAENALKQLNASLRKTAELDLPEAMALAGMASFTLASGKTIAVTETLYASIPKKNKPQAAKWLEEHDLGALVKADVVVPFEKGQQELIEELVRILQLNGFDNFSQTESMNTSSVKSAIKELMESGQDVPLELFGAHFVKKAVVK